MTETEMIFTLHANPSTTNARGRVEDRIDTLGNLRAWLIGEAHRYDWNLEGLQDLADSIENGSAPPAVPDEVVSIAAQVWDESPSNVYLTEGAPLDDLATAAQSRQQLQAQLDATRQMLEETAQRAYDAGFSAYRIAQVTGVTHTTVARWLNTPTQKK